VPVPSTAGAIFLSYAREDTNAACRIADALRGFGMEVWFDQRELRGGDVWDAKIKQQIRECTLFLPIISAHTQARTEGYFRREWNLVVERMRDMAHHVTFIVPVVIDGTPESRAAVPEEFLRAHWTRLLDGVPTTEFVERIRSLLIDRTDGSPPPPAPSENFTTRIRPVRTRILVGMGLLAATVLALVIWKTPRPPADRSGSVPASPPVVVLMDASHERRVYDKDTRESGGTNADDISELLRELPITVMKELTFKDWARDTAVAKANPALIVVHRSCFNTYPGQEADVVRSLATIRLIGFLGYLATVNPQTKFLVYSRGNLGGETGWQVQAEKQFPVLSGRIRVYTVPRGRATFRDPLTGRELKEEIERILGFTSGARQKS
jgi:hypothetical protein